MGVNRTPGQSASGFRMYVDKSKKGTPTNKEDVKEGVKFLYKGMEYTVAWVKGDDVWMDATDGIRRRSTIVPISDLTKSGTEYILITDEV